MVKATDKTAKKQQKVKVRGKPFPPGHSGNPNGRPKGSISITARIKKELAKIPKGQKVTYLEILVKQILKKAIVSEDKETIKLIWNYVDGMPKQALEHIGDEDRPLRILYVPAKSRSNRRISKK